MQPRTWYENTQTGEMTDNHREAMEWYRAHVDVYLYRETQGGLVPAPVPAWVN